MKTDQLPTLLPNGINPKLMGLLRDIIAAIKENKLLEAPGYRLKRTPNGTSQIIEGADGQGGSSVPRWG